MAKERRIATFLALSAAAAVTVLASTPSTHVDRADATYTTSVTVDSRAGLDSDGGHDGGGAVRETGGALDDHTDPESCGGPTSSGATLRVVHITDVYTLANFPHLAELIRQERECRECIHAIRSTTDIRLAGFVLFSSLLIFLLNGSRLLDESIMFTQMFVHFSHGCVWVCGWGVGGQCMVRFDEAKTVH